MSESEIMVGDRFIVEVEVVTLGYMGGGYVLVHGPLSETYGTNALHRDQLLASQRVEPALEVGDKARFKKSIHHDGVNRTVIGIDGDAAWLKCCDKNNYKYRMSASLSDLERVP